MSEKEGKIIEGHNYDGIQELDHPLPKWWVYLFYLTIIFSVGYYAYYEFLGGPSSQQELEAQLAHYESQKPPPAEQAPAAEDEVDVEALLSDIEAMEVGKKNYMQYCVACHAQQGEGGIGPNLTDKYWIHSKGKVPGILKAIRLGFPNKGMPPWGNVVAADDQLALAAYVVSLQGTNPSNGKKPEGEPVD